MQLVLDQVRKPIRELRKSLRDLPGSLPQKAVHKLRTRSRRIEAVGSALPPRQHEKVQQLLKTIKPLRKAAGEVRDMDVLETKVRTLLRRNHDPSFENLLAHLVTVREQSACVLAENLSADRKVVRSRLKKFSKFLDKCSTESKPESRQAHKLFEALCHSPKLNAGNLHDFRIKLKELLYMVQLMGSANADLVKELENAKVRIGDWHDWEELHRIANEVLDAHKDRNALAAIAEIESRKLGSAMRAAQSLRTHYFMIRSNIEIAES